MLRLVSSVHARSKYAGYAVPPSIPTIKVPPVQTYSILYMIHTGHPVPKAPPNIIGI